MVYGIDSYSVWYRLMLKAVNSIQRPHDLPIPSDDHAPRKCTLHSTACDDSKTARWREERQQQALSDYASVVSAVEHAGAKVGLAASLLCGALFIARRRALRSTAEVQKMKQEIKIVKKG